MSDEDTIPFEEDTTSPDAEAVKSYLEEAGTEIPDDVKAMLEDDAESQSRAEVQEERKTLEVDNTFEENRRESFENMIVPVRDIDVPVTDEDKSLYLKGLLNSTPITLTITAKNGASGKCRTLSVYEGDVIAEALRIYLQEYPGTQVMYYESIMQQYRIAMQLVEYCGRKLDYLSFERVSNTSLKEHAKELFEKAQDILDVPGPVYGMYVRLTNVFQYKINRLQEAAFNSDFWSPVDTD